MLEKDIEKILTKEVRLMGGRAYKWVSPGNTGVPDRIVFLPDGRIIFVELKTDTGKLSSLQKAQIAKLKALGQTVQVVQGLQGLIRFFQDIGGQEAAERTRKRLKMR